MKLCESTSPGCERTGPRMWNHWSLVVEVLVPECGSTGPQMWKYWSPDVEVLVPGCGSTGPWMCQIVSVNAAGKVRDIFEKNESLQLIV